MTIRIRRATAHDCPLINQMAWQVFPHTYRNILTREQTEYMMEWMYSVESLTKQLASGHTYYIAYYDDQPAGYVSIEQHEKDLFHLQKIYVLPQFQGLGLGRKLFRTATNHITQHHPTACTMELNVNRKNPAVGFYEQMGMHKDRQGDFPIGHGYYMNDYIMAMQL